MGKMSLLVGAGIGYLLGSRAGRKPYEKVSAEARRLMKDPRVKRGVHEATQTVKDKASEVTDKVAHSNTSNSGPAGANASMSDPDIDMTAGPRGDLP